MNKKSCTPEIAPIADVQSSLDIRQIPINKVGIRSIRYPVQVKDVDGEVQSTIATFNMYVNLPKHSKGTHMSRFIEILDEMKTPFSAELLERLLDDICLKLHSDEAYLEMSFPFFVRKQAPVTGVESMMDYEVEWKAEKQKGQTSLQMKLAVPVTSLCPCSKKISNYGAHNQRSQVTLTVQGREKIGIGEMLRMVESQASSELYGLLKRPDEKFITERAYDNPKFVEDMVRDIAVQMNEDQRILSYVVESENFESIHNHSAYARIEFTKPEKSESAS